MMKRWMAAGAIAALAAACGSSGVRTQDAAFQYDVIMRG